MELSQAGSGLGRILPGTGQSKTGFDFRHGQAGTVFDTPGFGVISYLGSERGMGSFSFC